MALKMRCDTAETQRGDAKMIEDVTGRAPRKINLRFITSVDDLNALMPLLVELHEESRFRDIPFSSKKCEKLLFQTVENPDRYAAVIAEFDGKPVGFIYCAVGEHLVGTGILMTTVFAFYVRKLYREAMIGGKAAIRLLSTIIEWSKQRNSREIMIHVTSGIDIQRTDKFLRRARFRVIGANYSFAIGSGERAP